LLLGTSFVGIRDAYAKNIHEQKRQHVHWEKQCLVFRAGRAGESGSGGQREIAPFEARFPGGYSFGVPLPSSLNAFSWIRYPAPNAR